jgi:hypothetical protein
VSENNGPKSGSAAKGVAREQVENVPSEGLLKVEEAVKRFHDNRSGDSHATGAQHALQRQTARPQFPRPLATRQE